MQVNGPYFNAVRRYKRELIERALGDADGNVTHAARALGMHRTYLYHLIHDLDVTIQLGVQR